MLAAPGSSAVSLSHFFNPERVVSYGLSARDSLTVSSVNGEQILICVQREFTTLSGSVLEPQEIKLELPASLTPSCLLSAVTALLLLDFPPELIR